MRLWRGSPARRCTSGARWITKAVLDIVVQSGRDKAAALKLMRKLLKKQGLALTVIVTEKLRLHTAAFAELGLAAYRAKPEAEQPGGSCTPAGPRCERKVPRFKLAGSAQLFLTMHVADHNTFHVQRHVICHRTLCLFRADKAISSNLYGFYSRECDVPSRLYMDCARLLIAVQCARIR
jgi:hypothetical protein